MKKLLSIIMICLIGCCCFIGCSSKGNDNALKVTNASQKKANPKDIIYEYFKYWNDKNLDKMELLQSEELKKQHKNFEINNLKSIKLIACKEWNVKEEIKKAICSKFNIKESIKENVKCFTVQFDINLKKDKKENKNLKGSSGIIILVRKDKNSTWLIGDIMVNDDFLKNINEK